MGMAKNKKEYQHNLHMAVLNQQRSLAALNSATTKRISQTNKNIAANAAQIKINARKARKDLESAMGRFGKNMLAVTKEAAAGRSKLAATAKAMDRRFRAMVDNKIKGIVAWSSAQFAKVRSTMAKDRHHADMALKHAAQRMQAALNAHNALQDKRFKQTVANIKLAKAEAKARVDAATSEFKMNILHLQSTVKHQVFKLNSRVTALQGVITKNKLEQAKVNKNGQEQSCHRQAHAADGQEFHAPDWQDPGSDEEGPRRSGAPSRQGHFQALCHPCQEQGRPGCCERPAHGGDPSCSSRHGRGSPCRQALLRWPPRLPQQGCCQERQEGQFYGREAHWRRSR